MEEMFRVGVITSTHGLAGDVKVFPTTDDVQRFRFLEEVLADTKHGLIKLRVDRVRFFKQFVIVHFEGKDRIEDVEGMSKCDLLVTREHALPLEEGQYYLADLIGLKAEDETGRLLGTVTDVLQTGANDVYVVQNLPDPKELLIPAIPDCILKIDLEQGKMTVHLLPGLE